MIDIPNDQMISLALVAGLLVISKARDMLDNGGIVAALTVGLIVSLAGHWTWLVILMSFLALGSSATKWKYEEKMVISLACLLYTSPSPRDLSTSRMPSSA